MLYVRLTISLRRCATNTSEQVQRLAVIQNATANGVLQRALGSLARAPEAEQRQLAALAGLSRLQLTEWMDGKWCPPTDQLLVVQGLTLDRWHRVMGTGQLVSA